jgi:hypothetical protein
MALKIFITIGLTITLIGIPYFILKDFEATLVRTKEKAEWFNKFDNHHVESIHLRVWSKKDSLLIDSMIIDERIIEPIKAEYLELPKGVNSIPSLIWMKKMGLTFIQNSSDSLSSTIYVTPSTALVFIHTQGAKDFDGLDDLYSAENLKSVFVDFK